MGAPPVPAGSHVRSDAEPSPAVPATDGSTSAAAAAATFDTGDDDDEPSEDLEAKMMAEIMGFSGFDSTAGKGVDDPRCKMEGVHHKEQRRYRQYMNRRGGFNRPLDAV